MTGLCLIIAAGPVLGQGCGQCGSSVCRVRRSVERFRRSTPDITIPEVVEGVEALQVGRRRPEDRSRVIYSKCRATLGPSPINALILFSKPSRNCSEFSQAMW